MAMVPAPAAFGAPATPQPDAQTSTEVADAPPPPRRETKGRPPRDPNDLPPLSPPNGQPMPDSLRRDVDHTSNDSRRRRLVLTALPLYASFRLGFLGRRSVPTRGGGIGVAAQIPVWHPFGLRATASHTVHPVSDQFVRDDEEALVQTAARGMVQATHAGLSATYTMDLGRVITTLDAGAGAMWVRSPSAVQDGQLGGACLTDNICDIGLACSDQNVCQVGTTFQAHGGFALDVLLGDRFAVGGELRYHALLSAPTNYPVYLIAALRGSIRF
ncbi:MAG: hypothetical protein K0V04_46205 [Deltaproteobacteria bacterium]|nr:hypothetical protein [Deltaproteobacteria bacterium]